MTAPPGADALLAAVERYYSEKIAAHGPTAAGVDWRDAESQELRFAQLARILDADRPFSVLDYGCGYGALARYLGRRFGDFAYQGFDISQPMLTQARRFAGSDRREFVGDRERLRAADYVIASGVFNVKLDATDDEWSAYARSTIAQFDALARRGFAFNMLTSYSDPELMREDLFYAEPGEWFAHCKARSRHVALLHDYGLYEFTLLVRKEPHR